MFRESWIVLPPLKEIYESTQLQGGVLASRAANPPMRCEAAFWKAAPQRALRSSQLTASTRYLGQYFI